MGKTIENLVYRSIVPCFALISTGLSLWENPYIKSLHLQSQKLLSLLLKNLETVHVKLNAMIETEAFYYAFCVRQLSKFNKSKYLSKKVLSNQSIFFISIRSLPLPMPTLALTIEIDLKSILCYHNCIIHDNTLFG